MKIRQPEQGEHEKDSKNQNSINQFPLRREVHENSGYQRGLKGSYQHTDSHVQFMRAEIDIREKYSEERADEQHAPNH